jgi:hypothetical protein
MNEKNINDLYDEIFKRKSVRHFEKRDIDKALAEKIQAAISETAPLSESPAALRVFPAAEAGVSFGGAPCCLGSYCGNEAGAQLNAACMLQEMSLRLSLMGLGSCWIGMAKAKGPYAEYQGLPFFKLLAFGHPAEALHREGRFDRKPLPEITDIQGRDNLLETVRLAPSAMNRQGWYLSAEGNKIRLSMAGNNFLIKKLMDPLTVSDAGIALCHLRLGALRNGGFVSAYSEDGVAPVKKNYSYVWTIEVTG